MGHVYKLTGKENKKKNVELLFIMKNNLFDKKDNKNIVLKRERMANSVIDSLDLRQQKFSFGDS
ncbi:MAG: hypothetical protein A2860_00325 [Candidatus Levybacteria bacterium RIFCSPHIGHO2_01_FULL_37_33]|nr:MAG: hypothetical protein A2860_00325 [Candidatus Levybacteria bacterium RIFCSPHIGHO2_01_FULL_37_33]OGH17119.1 MAG: hypothetical protein A3C97_00735 [Candidatus Levybacteria bacterium RIFCSPHIGHO2_02_FULL_37_11]OGH29835.1 MAG: hypothetical protein A3F30_00250 [Candidatus Levybacteria bacterium RIFCSPHIGHO2_12_FULL_37_12]OGH32897.1 MAG: hypothetical protein A2953_02020 [Candidatus Levybacteria bacterium RIFCSPLOWO2_01_FULL_36_54]